MTANRTYYAYIHCKPDGTPFYVGKGNSHRARAVRRVNAWHSNIVGYYGAENILIGKMACSTEALAFELEKGVIKCLRRMGHTLVNQTDGGEGSSGYVTTAEAKAKIAAALTGIKRSDEFKDKMVKVGKIRGVSPAAREANIKALTGKKQAPEMVARRMASRAGYVHAPETKEKIARAVSEAWEKKIATLGHGGDERFCGGCGRVKDKSEFGPDARKRGGIRPTCKSCLARQARERRAKRASH